MNYLWNKRHEPISERLRDPDEILNVTNKKTMIYNPNTKQTALVMEVFVVEQDENSIENGYTVDEDRWVEYVTDEGPLEDFSVDLDDEGWLWHDELEVQ
jgi:hypothetical protein